MPDRLVAQKSKDSFDALYERVARRLLVFLVRRMHDTDAATELWAECWALAFGGWRGCSARSDGEADAWVFGIARNQLGRYYRSGEIATRTLEQLKWTLPRAPDSERAEIEREANLTALRVALSEALSHLSSMRRRAIQLRILDDLAYEEVASRLGCSQDAARAHVSRGLRQLERQMSREQVLELEGALP